MKYLTLVLSIVLLASPAFAKGESPVVRGYQDAMETMHRDMRMNYTGDADTDFVRGMVPHHQGAVDMAEVELKHGKDADMRKLAEHIITNQKQEIAFLSRWLERRGQKEPRRTDAAINDKEIVQELRKADQTMHHAMMIDYTGNADIDFARGMIPHHQGAVDMAEALLRHGRDLELKKMARDIINSQLFEIKLMQDWLAKHPSAAAKKPSKNKHSAHHG